MHRHRQQNKKTIQGISIGEDRMLPHLSENRQFKKTIGGERMKPALPTIRSRPQLHADITVHATEPTATKNYRWASKTFPDVNRRMRTDSESEYELPTADHHEQSDYNYEYVTSSLEDLRHVKIYPAKPMNMQSVYADKRCLPTVPPPLRPKGDLPPCQRPQAAPRQQSMTNIQPSMQYSSSNMQREKQGSNSHRGFTAQGPAVDRTVKPFKSVKVPFQVSEKSPILDYKQPGLPPPRLRKNKRNEAIIPRNVRQHHSLPVRLISRSSPTASSSHQTVQMPVKLLQDTSRSSKHQSSPDLQKPKHFPSPAAKDLEGKKWYIGAYDRYEAEEALRINNKNGAFLVRDSSKGIPDKPYVLVVYYRFKVYSIQIRYLEGRKQYALGSGLRGHDVFDSVPDMIEFHKNIPLRLIDRRDQSGSQMEQCTLTFPLTLH
ncbi:cytokine-dependent hematopoietic cell linker isoform X7 [Heptranchias perlo]|uniref:cytokine-dependent hematopoietic cell linker isoform X7 n=1 Tax=Heptranchias perlo TaxID=212740 RepID=UPI00355A7D24